MDTANRMAYNFANIEELPRLSKKQFINTLFDVYNVAYENDRSNAVLMADRLRLMTFLKPQGMLKAMTVAQKGYELGEQIRKEVLQYKSGSRMDVDQTIDTSGFRL